MKRTGIYITQEEMKGDLNDKAYCQTLAVKHDVAGNVGFIQPGTGEFWVEEPELPKRAEPRDDGEEEQHLAEEARYVKPVGKKKGVKHA